MVGSAHPTKRNRPDPDPRNQRRSEGGTGLVIRRHPAVLMPGRERGDMAASLPDPRGGRDALLSVAWKSQVSEAGRDARPTEKACDFPVGRASVPVPCGREI